MICAVMALVVRDVFPALVAFAVALANVDAGGAAAAVVAADIELQDTLGNQHPPPAEHASSSGYPPHQAHL